MPKPAEPKAPEGGWLLREQPECQHTPRPRGYAEFCAWSDEMRKSHYQTRCSICGLWSVWVPKEAS